MLKDRKAIDSFLWENYRKLKNPEFLFGIDNNQDPVEKFDKEGVLRILVVFLSPGKIRAVSNTFQALNSLLHEGVEDEVFVDFCYSHEFENQEIFIENGIPLLFGNVSHAPATDYDVIMVSHSIIPEIVNYPPLLVHSGISVNYEDRIKDEKTPIIIYGGAGSLTGLIAMGNTGRGGHSLIDMAFFGHGDGIIEPLVQELVELHHKSPIKSNKVRVFDFFKEDSQLKEYAYHPTAYRYNYELKEDGLYIKSIDKLDDRVPDKVKIKKGSPDFKGFAKKIFYLDGSAAGRHDLQIATGCSGEGSCSFCMEAQISGGYTEKDLPALIKDMDDMKRYAATYTLGFYSFNLNYYKHFLDLMKAGAERFNNLSLITMRTDVIAAAPEYVKLAKKLGLMKISMAIEGMGERIRNKILNKNLHRDQIMKAVRNCFREKLLSIKMNIIITGQETEEDIDEWLDEIDEILAIRDEMGSRTALRVTHTPLVIYDQTPLRWLPRIPAKNSWYNIKTMMRYVDEMRKRNIRVKFHGGGPGTYIDQLILDLGRYGTEFLLDVTLNEGLRFVRGFTPTDGEIVKKSLDKLGIPVDVIFRERGLDEIMPSDTIQFTPQQRIEKWKEMHRKRDFEQEICLKTPAHPVGKCFNCGNCETVEQKKAIINRPLTNESTVDDVIDALSVQRKVDGHRIVLKQNPKWEFYSRDTLSNYVASQFLRRSDDLLDAYYGVGHNTLSWVSNKGQIAWAGGKWVFDLFWNRRVSDKEVLSLVEDINKDLESCQIIAVYPDATQLPVKINNEVAWFGYLENHTMSKIRNNIAEFNWNVQVAKKVIGVGMETETKYIPELKDKVLFVPYKDKILVYLVLPMNLNPYLITSSLVGTRFNQLLQDIKFSVQDHVTEVDANCSCGRPLAYSLIKGKTEKLCPICQGKRFLHYISKRA